MVEVLIGSDDKWEFLQLASGGTQIMRNGYILGYVTIQIPQSEQLLYIAFEGITEDIKRALTKQEELK